MKSQECCGVLHTILDIYVCIHAFVRKYNDESMLLAEGTAHMITSRFRLAGMINLEEKLGL